MIESVFENQFIFPLRIYTEDTDYGGVVYHTNYIKYMERARSEWLSQYGFGIEWQREQQVYFVIHSLQIRYLKPATMQDRVEVFSSIKQLKQATIVFDQELRSADGSDNMFCKAQIKIAFVDEAMRPKALPASPFLTSIRRQLK